MTTKYNNENAMFDMWIGKCIIEAISSAHSNNNIKKTCYEMTYIIIFNHHVSVSEIVSLGFDNNTIRQVRVFIILYDTF